MSAPMDAPRVHDDNHDSPPDSNASPKPEHGEKHVDEVDEDANDGDLTLSQHEYRRIVHKLDWAIIPYCSLLYLLSFLDRVNIGQAAVAGLKGDLGIVQGNAYAISLSVFFIGYIIVEVSGEPGQNAPY